MFKYMFTAIVLKSLNRARLLTQWQGLQLSFSQFAINLIQVLQYNHLVSISLV